jgi:hypothetical protein
MAGGYALQDLISNAKDYSRGYLFYLDINAMPVGGITRDLRYLVRTTNLPASTIEVATTNWQGNAYKLGTTQTFEDLTVSFNADVNDNIRHTMLNWVELVHNASSNVHGGPQTGAAYMTTVTLQHLSHQDRNQPISTYKLIGAYPTVVGQMSLDYANKDVAQFDVTFTYQYHTTGVTDAPPAGAEDQTVPGGGALHTG